MQRVCFLGLLLVVPCVSLPGQNVSLELGNAQAPSGSRVEIPILLSTDAPLAGFTIVCDWDSSVGTGVELKDLAVTSGDQGVLVHVADVRSDHMIMVLALSPFPAANLLPPGEDIVLANLVIDCGAGESTTSSDLSFRDDTYNTDPPGPSALANSVTVFFDNGFPELNANTGLELTDGSLTCTAAPEGGGAPNVRLSLGEAEAQAGSQLEIPVLLNTDAPVAGFTMACGWDSALGTGVALKDLAVAPGDPGVLVHVAEVRSDHMIMVLALSPFPAANLLAPGDDILLANLVIECDTDDSTKSGAVSFRDNAFNTDPPGPSALTNSVTVFFDNDFPEFNADTGLELSSGTIKCTGGGAPPDFRLSLDHAEAQFGSQVEIPLRLSTSAPVQGVNAVFDWAGAAGTAVDLIVDTEIDDAAQFVNFVVEDNWMALGITSVTRPLNGDDILLATVVIQCGLGPEVTDTPIAFRDGVHSAPGSPLLLFNAVTVGGASVRQADGLTLTDGAFGCSPKSFIRGDGNDDGFVDLSDAVTILSCMFGSSTCPGCFDAADCNDDGLIDVSDAVCVLGCVFGTAACPAPPFPGCSVDVTSDSLECADYRSCSD